MSIKIKIFGTASFLSSFWPGYEKKKIHLSRNTAHRSDFSANAEGLYAQILQTA